MIELGLNRISQLVKHTPLKWKAVHIAGTNGKGSVASYLSALLTKGGIKTGRFTSPHLIDRWDCIAIDNQTVEKSLFDHVEAGVKARNLKHKIGASEFELLTATAFEVFNIEEVRLGVIEVGLGGRLDATNVLAPEEVVLSVITKIGLDHQALLGNTLAEIATEKGGIIKESVACLIDDTNEPEVIASLKACASQVDAGRHIQRVIISPRMISPSEDRRLKEVRRELNLEPHQRTNLRLAVDALDHIRRLYPLNQEIEALIEHVPEIQWPGRLQTISIETLTGHSASVTLDGAHNVQSAGVLARYVARRVRRGKKAVTWVLAFSKGKDVREIVEHLVRQGDQVIATRFGPVDGMPWVESADLKDISDAIQKSQQQLGSTTSVENVREALAEATRISRDKPIVIAGSLYLVSDVLRLLRDS